MPILKLFRDITMPCMPHRWSMSTCENGDERVVYAHGICRPCYMRAWRAGQPSARRPAEPTKTPCSYKHAHGKVRRYRGRAADQACAWPGCKSQATEWSYTPGSEYEQSGDIPTWGKTGNRLTTFVKWSPWPYDYEPLCRPHHLQKDGRA